MAIPQHDRSALDNVLVLTVRKSFWASRECEIFPNRIYTRIFYGYSQNLLNSLFVALMGLIYFLVHRPKLILFGYAHRIVPWYITLRKASLLRGVKLVATNQVYFSDLQAQCVDRIIVYSRGQIAHRPAAVRNRCEFMPLTPPGRFDLQRSSQLGNYIFSGGVAGRDFESLIKAVRGLDVRVKIVTFSPKTLGYTGKLPGNCEVHWRMPLQDYLELMAGSLFVVIPLQEGWSQHGQVTVAQALRLGKAVVSTRDASVADYITDGREGILVSPGNVIGYRQAILSLLNDSALRESFERHARAKSMDLTDEVFAERLIALCNDVLAT